jgi:triacylglycerol lipase
MVVIIGIALAVFVGFALLTYGFFWYETANSSYRQRLEELSQGHPGRMVLRGILSGVLSQLMVVLCFPLQWWQSLWQPRSRPSPEHPPIFLVHGIYHNASAWTLYRWWLRGAGFTDIYAFSYNSLTKGFDQIQQHFDQWVQATMAERHSGQRALMIGHSLGGLIIRAHLSNADAARRVAAVVTLGTPYQGSKLAVLGISRLAWALIFRGPLSRQLEDLPQPQGVDRLAVLSPVDNMVLPHEALRTAQVGWQYLETSPVSHVALLYHRPTARRVIEFLKQFIASGQGPT